MFVVLVFLVLLIGDSLQCVPGNCPSSFTNLTSIKSGAPYTFKVGYIAFCGVRNSIDYARWVFHDTNNNPSILPHVNLELYYHTVCTPQEVVSATNELLTVDKTPAVILELGEFYTLIGAQIAIAYGASVLSITSLTSIFDDKRAFDYKFARLLTPGSLQLKAALNTLSNLKINHVVYIYTNDIYGSQNYLLFSVYAAKQNLLVTPIAIDITTVPPDFIVDARALFFDTSPAEGAGFIKQLVKSRIYGKEYLYIFTTPVVRAIQQGCPTDFPMLDGSLVISPVSTTKSAYSEYYSAGWNNSDPSLFRGARPVDVGSTAIDAATAYISTLDSLVNAGIHPDTINGSTLHKRMLSMEHPSFSGDFEFNENADRTVDVLVYNLRVLPKQGSCNYTVSSNAVAVYNISNGTILFYPTQLIYFNGSTILPVLVHRASDDCSFEICHFRGNCSRDARCICDAGFSGAYCENRLDMVQSFGTSTIAAWAVPVSMAVISAIVIGMYVLHRRRKTTLIKNITEQQRSQIPRGDLKILNRIGRGASGEVTKAMFRGTEVAVKRLISPTTSSKSVVEEFMYETAMMCGLRHPNIVLFMGSCFDPIQKEMLLVMEYMSRGSVHDVIHNQKIFMPYELKIHLALQAAQGMNFLHNSTPPVIHRDLKSHNILLDDKWNARISDFGITRFKEINKYSAYDGIKPSRIFPADLGTIFWTAPEVLNGTSHSESSDCYAFGIVLWEIFHRAEPYMGMETMVVAVEVPSKGRRPEISDSCCPHEIKELMRSCWSQEPNKRPSFQDVVNVLKALTSIHPLHNIETSNSRVEAPTGLAYFVHTNIASAYELWEAAPRAFQQAIKLHNQLVRSTLEEYGGYEVSFSGTSFVATFSSLVAAVDWCIHLQEVLLRAEWPKQILTCAGAEEQTTEKGEIIRRGPRVRMALHSGVAQCTQDHLTGRVVYGGIVVDRVQSMLANTTLGEIIVSGTVQDELVNKKIKLDTICIDRLEGLDKGVYYMVTPASLFHRRPAAIDAMTYQLNMMPEVKEGAQTAPGGLKPKEPVVPKKPKWLVKWNELAIKEMLGVGTVGEFHRAILDGKEVAVKCLINQKIVEQDILELTANSVVLARISHPNLLPFYGVCLDKQNVSIITEYVSMGNLRAILSDESTPIPLARRLKMAKEIAAGMTYLSMHPDPAVRVHDNFKSHNIMITQDWSVKISDFGQSSVKDLCRTMTSVTNVAWTAPEALEGEPLNNNSSLYSFGIILWEIITRKIPYQNEHPIRIVNKILGGHRPAVPKEGVPQQYKDLMESCWHPYAHMRPSWHVIQSELSFILDGLQTQ